MFAISGMPKDTACVKEFVGDYEISIAFDDSCGVTNELSRSNIRVFLDDKDITALIFGAILVPGTLENLFRAYHYALVSGRES